MVDTVKIIHDTFLIRSINPSPIPVDGIDVLNKVDGFYKTSWNNLYNTISLGLTLLGVLITVSVFVIQKYTIKHFKYEMKAFVKEESDLFNKQLKENLNEHMNKEFVIQKANLARMEGSILLYEGKYKSALWYFKNSAEVYLQHKEMYASLQNTVNKIEDLLDKLNKSKESKEEINSIKGDFDLKFPEFIDMIRSNTEHTVIIYTCNVIMEKWRKLADNQQLTDNGSQEKGQSKQ